MNTLLNALYELIPLHPFLAWQDIAEITLFILFFYTITTWLARHNGTRLNVYFYSYYALWYGAHYYNTHSLFLILSLAFPAALLLCILAHQDFLQRNLIAFRSRPIATHNTAWLETLLQLSLVAQHRNQKIVWLIERFDQLNEFLQVGFYCNAPLSAEFMHTILESKRYNDSAMIWINTHGTALGIHSTWKDPSSSSTDLINTSLLYTHKLDALVCIIDPSTTTYTIIAHGSSISCATIQHVLLTIKKHIQTSYSSSGDRHAMHSQKDSFKQRTP